MDPFTRHGGDVAEAERRWPEAPRPWIDLSTGINPRAYPARPAGFASRKRLPLGEDLRALEAVAAVSFGAPLPGWVTAVPGAEAALRLAPSLIDTPEVAVASPTYGGHAEAWEAAGKRVLTAPWEVAREAARVVVAVNPNNPDGRRLTPRKLLETADRLAERDGLLIVDESFGEVAPELSVCASAHPRLVVLRSFGKFYGLAGLRLGFVVAPPALTARVRARLGDWPVSVDAIAAGRRAYGDARWAQRTRVRLARDAARLGGSLAAAGFEPLGGTDLFALVRHPAAGRWFERLARAGILVRPFADAPDRLRFGLPPPGAWRRLKAVLGETP